MNETPRYFAIPDPLDPAKASYWYEPTKGRDAGTLQPWPPRRSKWGALYARDIPHDKKVDRDGYYGYVRAHFMKVNVAHGEAVKTAEDTAGLMT